MAKKVVESMVRDLSGRSVPARISRDVNPYVGITIPYEDIPDWLNFPGILAGQVDESLGINGTRVEANEDTDETYAIRVYPYGGGL